MADRLLSTAARILRRQARFIKEPHELDGKWFLDCDEALAAKVDHDEMIGAARQLEARMRPIPRPALLDASSDDKKRLANLRRRVSRAREFPTNTCGASRHLIIVADVLSKHGTFVEDPMHCAESIYAVIAALWEARTALARLKDNPGRRAR